ncbi:MAG: ribose ABC transporter permease [Spirochaetales bacterium]|nr:ribose ABC transporter permease [Spirochaetales bacterium]
MNNSLSVNVKLGVKSYLHRYLGILIGLFALCLVLSLNSSAFLTSANILNVLRQVSINAILAFGMTYAILIGGIDLSVGSVLALTGTIVTGLITRNMVPIPVAVGIGLILGLFLGVFNGVIIAKTGIPPFIVTLAMMQIARGLAYVYTNGQPIRITDGGFIGIGTGYLGPIPLPIIYTVVIFIVVSIMLNKTKFGRYVYALGGNKDAAIFSGIKIKNITIAVYALIGLLSAICGIVLSARMYSGQPTVGNGFELDAIAAVVLGGTSMSGGVGNLGGTLLGALVIGVLNNGLNLLNINSFWQLIIKGFVILLAVYVDSVKKKK